MEKEALDKRLLATKAEQTSLRSALDESEAKIQALSDQLNYARVTLQASETEVQGLHEDNAGLRKLADETARELNGSIRKNTALTAQVAELTEELAAYRSRSSDLDEHVRAKESELTDLCRMIVALRKEVKGYIEDLQHKNKGSDLLESPMKYPHSGGYDPNQDDEIPLNSSDQISGRFCMEQVQQLRQSIDILKERADGLATQNHNLQETTTKLRSELQTSKQHEDNCEQKLRAILIERDGLLHRLDSLQDEITVLRDQLSSLSSEKESTMISNEEIAQRLRTVRRELFTVLSSDAGGGLGFGSGKHRHGDTPEPGGSALPAVVRDLENAAAQVSRRLETLSGDDAAKKLALDRLSMDAAEKERSWALERSALMDRLSQATASLEEERSGNLQVRSDLQSVIMECDELRQTISEYARNNADLETEFRSTTDLNAELRSALNEAEALALDLRGKVKTLQQEVEQRTEELMTARDQCDMLRRRSSELELELEKVSSSMGRVRAEKDGMDNIRKSLEAELEKCRLELSQVRTQSKSDESGSSFELERLLSALGGTVEHLCTVFAPSRGGDSKNDGSRGRPLEFSATMMNKLKGMDNENDPMAHRVESAVRKLNELRSWSRDERRYREVLEERCESLEKDLSVALASLEDAQRELKHNLQELTEKDRQLRDRNRESGDLNSEVSKRQEEIDRLKHELNLLTTAFDEERRNKLRIVSENQSKDQEYASLRAEYDNIISQHNHLQEQIIQLKEQLGELKGEADVKNEQLRAAKATINRLTENIERLDKGNYRSQKEREELESKLQEAENMSVTITRLKSQLTEIQTKLQKSEDIRKTLTESKQIIEDRFEKLKSESEEDKRKLHFLESRYESTNKESSILDQELRDLRTELVKTRERLEFEYSNRMKAEAALENMRRVTEEWRSQADSAAGNRDAAEER